MLPAAFLPAFLLLALVSRPARGASDVPSPSDAFVIPTAWRLYPAMTFSFWSGGTASFSFDGIDSSDNMDYLYSYFSPWLPFGQTHTYQHAMYLVLCREGKFFQYLASADGRAGAESWLHYGFQSNPFDDTLQSWRETAINTNSNEVYEMLVRDRVCRDVHASANGAQVQPNALLQACEAVEPIYVRNMSITFPQSGGPLAGPSAPLPAEIDVDHVMAAGEPPTDRTDFDAIDATATNDTANNITVGPVLVRQTRVVIPVQRSGLYVGMLVKCGGIMNLTSFRVTGQYGQAPLNPIGWQLFVPSSSRQATHLTAGVINLLSVYAFSVLAWSALMAAWIANWYLSSPLSLVVRRRLRKADQMQPFFQTPKLYYFATTVPILRLAYLITSFLQLEALSTTGSKSVGAEIVRALLAGLSITMLYSTIILASKGWCITRRSFKTVEARAILGTVVMLLMFETCQYLLGGTILIGLLIMYWVLFQYIQHNFRFESSKHQEYLQCLAKANVSRPIIDAFEAKGRLMVQVKFSIVVTYPMYSWISFLLEEMALLLGSLAIGRALRLPSLTTVSQCTVVD
ncbi:hypothetical protein RI367_003787 [Sorochytrium milnesiophthora]